MGLVLAASLFYAGYQYSQRKTPSISVLPTGAPTPFPTPTPDATANWKTYKNKEFWYSISHPSEYEVMDNGKNSVLFGKRSNELGISDPINFIYISVIPKGFQSEGGEIYNYNTPQADLLFTMKAGETKQLGGNNDPLSAKFFSYTRIQDAVIGGLKAKTYVNTSPWDFPRGTKQYRHYVERGNNIYLVGGYIEGQDLPVEDSIPKQTFDQILSTFQFTQ